MRCPTCQARAECIDSRDSTVEQIRFRRRRWECTCGLRFTSAEFVVSTGDSRGYVRSIHKWLERIRRQGAAELIAKLEALIKPGDSNARLTNEERATLQGLAPTKGAAERIPAGGGDPAPYPDLAKPD